MNTILITLLIASIYHQWVAWYQSMKLIQAANLSPKLDWKKEKASSSIDQTIQLFETLIKELKKRQKK